MSNSQRKILVTSALPYANGSLHLGHLLETIQADIWVRFQKAHNQHCIYVCADDAHGTAIMLKAQQLGITPEQQIAAVKAEHEADFAAFNIDFDNYYSTHSEENRAFSESIYQRLSDNGHISSRSIVQAYDAEKGLFLADRFIKGRCPRCKTEDQYGDNCESCGATYSPSELIDPVSALSGSTPVEKESEHFFFTLPQFSDMLATWIDSGSLQPQVANKLREWIDAGLQEWDISRDAPYFGFEIPDAPGKYFYVWLDAPIGYMASFQNYCSKHDGNFDEFWNTDSDTELYHFIGKDIVNFHGLFWPAMLKSAGFRLPTALFVHGFVTVNGKKMSKSRGTFIKATSYAKYLDTEYLRYYYAAKLSNSVDDIDLNLEDFVQRVNSDLVGKLINIASRCANFITKGHDGMLSTELENPELWQQFTQKNSAIVTLYEQREFSKAIKEIMALADLANQYVAEKEPWALAKQGGNEQHIQDICSMAINFFRVLMVYLTPVLPVTAEKARNFLNDSLRWQEDIQPLLNHRINKFKPMLKRIEQEKIDAMLADGGNDKTASKKKPNVETSTDNNKVSAEGMINFDEFSKVDLRIAKIINAEHVDGADKLLKVTVDVGDHTRTIFAGIKAAYQPEDLIGRLTMIVANLAPRKMRFGVSEGMICAAGPGGKDIWLLSPDTGAQAGMRIS